MYTKNWWVHQGSNLGPTGYEPVALTTELWTRFIILRVLKITYYAYTPNKYILEQKKRI